MSKRLSEEQRKLILKDLRMTSFTLRHIAERHGVSTNQVWRIAYPHNLRPRKGRLCVVEHKVHGRDIVAEVTREALATYSIKHISEVTGYVGETFRRIRDGERHGQLGAFLSLIHVLGGELVFKRRPPNDA